MPEADHAAKEKEFFLDIPVRRRPGSSSRAPARTIGG